MQHFVLKDAQGHEPVRRTALLQIAEEVDDRVGHAVLVRRRQFEDAMRMQVGVKDLVLKVLCRPMINGLIDHAQQLAVLFIEKKRSEHGHDPENEKNGLTRYKERMKYLF